MTRLKLTFFLTVAFMASCVVATPAATNTLSIQYRNSWRDGVDARPKFTNSSFSKGPELNATPAPGIGVALPTTLSTDVHTFDVYMTITGLPPGEDFYSAQFDVVLGPGVTRPVPGFGYVENILYYDPPPDTGTCPSGCSPVFAVNSDAGNISTDLKSITVIVDEHNNFAGTRLRHPGEVEASSSTDPDNFNLSGPLYIGSIWVKWNGSLDNDVVPKTFVSLADPANVSTAWTSIDSNSVLHSYTAADMMQGPGSQWSRVPEPSTLVLLGLGAISLLGYRKAKSHG
jgi:PEP-CTERM motif